MAVLEERVFGARTALKNTLSDEGTVISAQTICVFFLSV